MPATLDYSHKILEQLAADRKGQGAVPRAGQCQLSLRYENGKPRMHRGRRLDPACEGLSRGRERSRAEEICEGVAAAVLPEGWLSDTTEWHINPTGAFEIGGPDGTGLTGRKIIVDTYGAAPHGGVFGKDPTKVDRSAAYITRHLAKNIVAAGLATRCTIQLAHAIGVSKPLSLYVDTHGTGTVSVEALETAIDDQGAWRPDPARHPRTSGA